MTLPFENDTGSIIKKLSGRSIYNNRGRNIFTVVTIALAAALLASIFLWTFGVRQENINIVKDTAQIAYHGLSKQQGDELYRQEEIEWVGESLIGPAKRSCGATVSFSYGNAEALASQQMTFRGEIPQNENEIMLPKSFLKVLGYGNKLGQNIRLVFEDGSEQEFVLTGIWSSAYEVKGSYLALVSKAYLDKMAGSDLPMAEKLNISDDQTITVMRVSKSVLHSRKNL